MLPCVCRMLCFQCVLPPPSGQKMHIKKKVIFKTLFKCSILISNDQLQAVNTELEMGLKKNLAQNIFKDRMCFAFSLIKQSHNLNRVFQSPKTNNTWDAGRKLQSPVSCVFCFVLCTPST